MHGIAMQIKMALKIKMRESEETRTLENRNENY